MNEQNTARLEWLLAETFDKGGLQLETSSMSHGENVAVVEFGPRMTFTSAFSSNATSICAACGLDAVSRLERSRRYAITFSSSSPEDDDDATIASIKKLLHDRMTEEEYVTPLTSFESGVETKEIQWVPIMEEGRAALEKINDEMGLGFDEWDLNYYTELFQVCCFRVYSLMMEYYLGVYIVILFAYDEEIDLCSFLRRTSFFFSCLQLHFQHALFQLFILLLLLLLLRLTAAKTRS